MIIIGKLVFCVDNTGQTKGLTLWKVYKVLNVVPSKESASSLLISVRNDEGVIYRYYDYRFKESLNAADVVKRSAPYPALVLQEAQEGGPFYNDDWEGDYDE